MTLQEIARRPWTESDKRDLIRFWDSVGSIFLISLLMDRPEGAIQTEASRLNLPRRSEEKGRHRKKWTSEEESRLEQAVARFKDSQGRIRIVEVSEAIGRSVDAIASRLADSFVDVRDFRKMIAFDREALLEKAAQPVAVVKPVSDRRKLSMIHTCLSCSKPFHSSGAGNRICKRCSSIDESDWF